MSWTNAVTELRALLSDGDTDKLCLRKAVFGTKDGTNLRFQTFEFRRITDFTAAEQPLGIYVNGSLVTVSLDFPDVGEFQLAIAPDNTDTLEATYYSQWFTDTELTQFLTSSAEWLGLNTIANVVDGLKPSARKFAQAEAYEKLAAKYSIMASEKFRLEDAPDPKTYNPVMNWLKLAEVARKQAQKNRDDFYTGEGKSLKPVGATLKGHVRNPVPRL